MANWCNVRLIVTGARHEVLSFSRSARMHPATFFTPDMLGGEEQELCSERIEKIGPNLARKVYKFQARGDDGREHFRRLSRQFPVLCFVVVYFDPNNDPSGSFFITRGRARSYELPAQLQEAVMAKHSLTEDVFNGEWSDDDDWHYWEASCELMDLAEEHWKPTLHKALKFG